MGRKGTWQTAIRAFTLGLLIQPMLVACVATPDPSTSSKPETTGVQSPTPSPFSTKGLSSSETNRIPSRSKASVLISGLAGPTQIALGPQGSWLVAELGGEDPSGDENGSTGRILLIDPKTKIKRVLAEGLDKPTGVAWIDNTVWIMVRRGIVRFPLTDAPLASLMKSKEIPAIQTVVSDLPFNGRSEGTLTPLPTGTFLYETTGNIKQSDASGEGLPEEGSGTLWSFDPQTNKSTAIAIGLKNSYAHVALSDGRVATTELGDNIDIEPLDEENILETVTAAKSGKAPQTFGWPICDAAGKPLTKADSPRCSEATPALRSFPAHLTPTGIAQYGKDLYVSLFVSGQIMRLPNDALTPTATPLNKRPAAQVWASDLEGPHTLLVDGTRLLVTETTAGRIVAFTLPS